MGKNLGSQIALAFERLLDAFLSVVPAALVLLAALLVGVLTGLLIRTLLRLAIYLRRKARRDDLSSSRQLLRAAGLKAEPERIVGIVSFWTTVVVSLAVGVNALEPGALRSVLSEAVSFLPRLLGAVLLAVVGVGVGSLVRRSVLLGAVNAGLPWARTGARAAYVLVVASFVAAALDHLGVGRSILVAAFTIVGGAIALTLALAFGLGARDLARGWLEKKLRAEEEDSGIRHL
ncbi:MAG: hypothetical protein IPN83_06355 [Holophagales bacterium]|jgi:hypothetical protein|nr:hypothetical protein [Holophagales bacterium]